jgi:hypothetical protein
MVVGPGKVEPSYATYFVNNRSSGLAFMSDTMSLSYSCSYRLMLRTVPPYSFGHHEFTRITDRAPGVGLSALIIISLEYPNANINVYSLRPDQAMQCSIGWLRFHSTVNGLIPL